MFISQIIQCQKLWIALQHTLTGHFIKYVLVVLPFCSHFCGTKFSKVLENIPQRF